MKNFFLGLTIAISFVAIDAHALTKAAVIKSLSKNVLLKTYSDMAQTSVDLKTAVDALIANPTQSNLETAQMRWRLARDAYECSEGFLFGPIDSLGIDPMIDTWPLALADMKTILTSDKTLDLEFMHSLNSNVLGFHAIEFLLFGEGVKTNTRDVTTITKREFDYLSGATILLVEHNKSLLYAWSTHSDPEDPKSLSYYDIISKPGKGNKTYSTEAAVIDQLAGGMVDILNEASTAKLPDAAGKNVSTSNARLEESPFSWNSINDYTSNVNSILAVYTGTYANKKNLGLKDLVALKDPKLAKQIEDQILAARESVQAIKGADNVSFGQAIKLQDGRVRIFAAIKNLKELQDVLSTKMIPLLK